ncbi:hypothetical protein ABK040_003310 [Willaertia magna]
MDQYPIELRNTPMPVIALVKNKRLHESLITTISNNLSKRMKILSLESEQELIKSKFSSFYNNGTMDNSNRFLGYKPVGIFKRSWYRKHQELIPSVCCILAHWKSEETTTWKSQEQELIRKIQLVKEQTNGKNIKFLALIITKKPPPIGEVPLDANTTQTADDFIYNIRKGSNLDGKNVILLKESELTDDQVFKSKVSKPLKELIVQYYKEQANMIKKFKSDVNKNLQPYLYVRHRMKIAFYTELLINSGFISNQQALTQKLIKYLTQAYNFLFLIKDYSLDEIKSVGDLINFKLCSIKLSDKRSIDSAIKQFLKHISWYKQMIDDKNLLFKHHARLYQQYRMMGEMMDRLPPNFISPDQRYQNPGFYYQAAATEAKYRKNYAQQQCENFREIVEQIFIGNEELLSKLKIDDFNNLNGYYGQLIEMPELLDQLKSTNLNIKYIRDIARELLLIKHSENIIQMLTNAYNHFNVKKESQLKRMMYFIASSIAEEHFESGNWEKSKLFYDKIAKHYRKEKWYDLLTTILEKSLECAKQLKLSKQFVLHSLELVSLLMNNSKQDKEKYLNDLFTFLNDPDALGLPPLNSPVSIELDAKNVLLQLKTQFSVPFAPVYQPVELSLQFTSFCPIPLQFSSLSVVFSDKEYNISITNENNKTMDEENNNNTTATDDQNNKTTTTQPLNDNLKKEDNNNDNNTINVSNNGNNNTSLILKGNMEPTIFTFPLVIKTKQDLQCLGISLSMKSSNTTNQQTVNNNQEIKFQWKLLDNDYYLSLLKNYDYRLFYSEGLFVERPVIVITEPEPNLTLSFVHLPPAIINEKYSIKVILKSNQDHVTDGRLLLEPIPDVEVTYLDKKNTQELIPIRNLNNGITFGEILPEEQTSILLFLKCFKPGLNKLQCKVIYGTTLYPTLERSTSFDVYCQYPFDTSFHFMGTRQSETQVLRDEKQQEIILNENEVMYRLLPSQKVSFYQKVISGQCQNVSVSDPLQKGSSSIGSSGFSYMEGFSVSQQIVLQSALKCNTPYPLILEEISVETSDKFSCLALPDMTREIYGKATKKVLEEKDEHTCSHILLANDVGRSVPVGSLKVRLRRGQSMNLDELDSNLIEKLSLSNIEFTAPLPSININDPGIHVSFCSPFEAILGQSIKCSIIIENNTPQLQQLQLFVSEAPSFFFAGTTNIRFTLLPYQSRDILYTMIPVATGLLEFPRFSLGSLRKQLHILNEEERWTIFVHPNTQYENSL